MTDHRSPIRFTGVTHIDEVIVAIAAIDSFTGRIVPLDPGDIELIDPGDNDANGIRLMKRPIRNLSGRVVFTRSTRIVDGEGKDVIEEEKPAYKIKIKAQKAGYFDPPTRLFNPPAPNDPDAIAKRKINISLHRLPSFSVPAETTIIAGVLHKLGIPFSGESIFAHLPPEILPPGVGALDPFETKSDERGAFSLALRLPSEARTSEEDMKFVFGNEGGREIKIPINIKEGERFKAVIKEGKRHSFSEPIELTSDNQPHLKLMIFGG